MDETSAASVEEVDGAPAATDQAASTDSGAPATPPEGYIPQDRYDNLRTEFNRSKALWDRAAQGDIEAMRELDLPLDFGDDGTDDEDDLGYRDPRVDQILHREQEREAREQQQAATQFRNDVAAHVESLIGDATLPDSVRRSIVPTLLNDLFPEAVASGDNQLEAVTEKFVTGLVKELGGLKQAGIDEWVASKKSGSRVAPSGVAANERPFRPDMSLDERIAAAQERARLLEE